jgi:hypothetical protein
MDPLFALQGSLPSQSGLSPEGLRVSVRTPRGTSWWDVPQKTSFSEGASEKAAQRFSAGKSF